MKLKRIKKWTIIVYFSLLLMLFIGVPIFIYQKSEKLRKQAYNTLGLFFQKHHKYVYLEFAWDKKFTSKREERVPIPPNPEQTAFSTTPKGKEEWQINYGDLYYLYSLGYEFCYHQEGKTKSIFPLHPCCFSWCLSVIERIEDGYIRYIIYPYRIGLKKQTDDYFNNYVPTTSAILENAFNFYTTNEKSGYSEYYTGIGDKKNELDYSILNEYYRIQRDTISALSFIGKDVMRHNGNRTPIDIGFMYTEYYKVFMRKSQPITFRITKVKDIEKEEIKKTLTTWIIRLTIVFVLLYLLIFIRERKLAILAKESLHSKLLRLCNPSRFMKPYNKEKVEKANSIYKELVEINENDTDKLKSIRKRAVQELGVNLLNKNEIEMLREKANPKNFIKPYRPNKIEKANELYDKLLLNNLDIDEIEEIEQQIKELYQ